MMSPNGAQTHMKTFFWKSFFCSFSGKFGEISAKILRTTKNLPTTPMFKLNETK